MSMTRKLVTPLEELWIRLRCKRCGVELCLPVTGQFDIPHSGPCGDPWLPMPDKGKSPTFELAALLTWLATNDDDRAGVSIAIETAAA
jgi:hypothetical protein